MSTFVLVHGACHGGWSWRPVAEILREQGHTVYTPTLPGLGAEDARTRVRLSDSVAALIDYVATRDLYDIVLVGHSWGGFPVSGAAAAIADRIDRLVYWSAFVPLTGESLIDLCPPAYGDMFRASAQSSRDNSVMFPFEVFATAFMQDVGAEVQRVIHPLLERQPFHTMNDSLDLDDWARLALPSVYLLAEDDLALSPGEYGWERFAGRLPAGSPVLRTLGSHEAQLSSPATLAASFVDAATVPLQPKVSSARR
ncbi:putative esterase [Gordonia polyisoprenivorans VH2]|uniref:Putative esterase n=1 Tax=Gordonia polyisoprenivorans (strain DSM 44266 / VH2) TaxID=1112204 RepID=H6N269_GORPV|nr:alpha/beta hydrolase family protein [Gordonia polyisoprenivorans]AFA75941.1 putative esterase [Gordonia polyisoprenivorans VH2]